MTGALHDSVVLLTGVTGYLGSLMLELILRSCPSVRQVCYSRVWLPTQASCVRQLAPCVCTRSLPP